MSVKGSLLQFIFDNGNQKNLISVDYVKRLGLPTTSHPQPYTIRWLYQVRDLHVSQQWLLPYSIKPFMDEVLCEISPLNVCDVLLGQTYLWKQHVVYESRPRVVIVTLGNKLYRILEVPQPTAISLVTKKNTVSSFPKLGNLFSWWSALEPRRIRWPRPPHKTPFHNNNKWTRYWRNTGTSSPHPQGCLCTVRSSTPSIWPKVPRCYTIFWSSNLLSLDGPKYTM